MTTMMTRDEMDSLSEKVGGRFRLTVLIQKRVQELVRGATKLVETDAVNLLDIALEEIRQGKIRFEDMEAPEEGKPKRRKKESKE